MQVRRGGEEKDGTGEDTRAGGSVPSAAPAARDTTASPFGAVGPLVLAAKARGGVSSLRPDGRGGGSCSAEASSARMEAMRRIERAGSAASGGRGDV